MQQCTVVSDALTYVQDSLSLTGEFVIFQDRSVKKKKYLVLRRGEESHAHTPVYN